MKTWKTFLSTVVLAILTMPLALPLLAQPASAETLTEPEVSTYRNKWQWIKTDEINVIFPAGGKKPMFLWWYANDTSNVYVVKYKGLVEFMTFDCPYYRRTCEATELRMQAMLNGTYFGPKQHMLQEMVRNRIRQRLMQLADYYDLHRAYLPFSGCEWNLTGPVEVTRGDVQYLSFNFTLVKVPFPDLKFAENNVIIRCRFYYTPATEDVEGLYTYSVDAGELKMDLIVSNWTWNVDLIQPLLDELADNGIEVPVRKAGLALWINLASISIEEIDLAEEDLETSDGQVETMSMVQNMYVEGAQVGVAQNKTQMPDEVEQPMTATARIRERYKLRFGEPDATLAGFFKYVPQALVRDGDDVTVVDVAASYIPAGHHMRLFLAYPYFGNSTLEHDPSLGLESLPALVTPTLLLLVVGTASVITIAVLAVRWKRRTVNIMGAQ
ncbi:MAG TPA: hypothetical protein VMW14_00070 [Candidatus Paceibacterota bacterium]|nr:hypothetical protein [Candidatus Paceibacterota bacterium]